MAHRSGHQSPGSLPGLIRPAHQEHQQLGSYAMKGGVLGRLRKSARATTSWDPSLLRCTEFLLIQVFFKLKPINSFWFNI